MSQEEVIKVLKRSRGPLSTGEISKQIEIAQSNISRNLNKLLKQKLVNYKKVKVPTHCKPLRIYTLRK